MAALSPIEGDINGCVVDGNGEPVAGVVVGDGETFWHSAAFDGAFAEDVEAMQASVASLLDPQRWPVDFQTDFFVWAAESGTSARPLDDPANPEWLADRDPDGSIRADLERLQLLDDGVISYVDAAMLLEARLRSAGLDVTSQVTPGGHEVDDKIALLVDWLLRAAS